VRGQVTDAAIALLKSDRVSLSRLLGIVYSGSGFSL
jgi:hypothetical protein